MGGVEGVFGQLGVSQPEVCVLEAFLVIWPDKHGPSEPVLIACSLWRQPDKTNMLMTSVGRKRVSHKLHSAASCSVCPKMSPVPGSQAGME